MPRKMLGTRHKVTVSDIQRNMRTVDAARMK